ncbi:c-type cytochrome [Deinococcus sedimenti]|uniref:C-type cytochrome n=1 Tax=Deinococcus sedimenti TaxID=1867090 RepID=A0ABQ2S2F7_9DEIO|nr:cytochrome c [Deinococcus sedimenti]GGR87035.1 c-type cytochrome [Deinococcus sedimenti]
MKNTFVVSMALLLALTIGGSIVGFKNATTPHHSEEKGHEETKAPSMGSEEAPSPNSASTGAEAAAGTTGDVTAANEGGEQAGANGAVSASGEGTTGEEQTSTTEGSATDTDTAGSTGEQPAETAAAAETQGDASAGEKTYAAVGCAGCHGANGQGVVGPSLVAANGPKDWTLAEFTTALREGKTPEKELAATMPRFTDAQITDSDIANLQAYIKTLN